MASRDASPVVRNRMVHNYGAGGEGGSLTLLGSYDPATRRQMVKEIEAIDPGISHIPTYLSRYGLRIWESVVE